MIEAGSETTAQILNNTIVGLLSNPEAIKLCQEELDRVIGNERTPSVDDVKDLPYVRSLVKVRHPGVWCMQLDSRVWVLTGWFSFVKRGSIHSTMSAILGAHIWLGKTSHLTSSSASPISSPTQI